MIHAQPHIKTHPAQGATIPTFSRSHAHDPTAISHGTSAPPSGPILTSEFTHDQIAERAYDIYVQNGRHEGQCQENWEQAENDLHHQGLVACHAEHVVKNVFAPDAIVAP